MRHLLVCLALLVSGASYVGPPPQQDGAKGKQEKKDVKAPDKIPYIEITKGGNGKFRFMVHKGDGTLLGESSCAFATEKDARAAIAEFRTAVYRAEIWPKL